MPPQIYNPVNILNICPRYIHPHPPRPAHANIGPSNLSDLQNINFTKNVTLTQVFSCILLVQFIVPSFSICGNFA